MLSQAHLVGNSDYTELLQSRGRGLFRKYSRTQSWLMKEANRPGPAPSIHKPGQLAVVLLWSWPLSLSLLLLVLGYLLLLLVSARIDCQYK